MNAEQTDFQTRLKAWRVSKGFTQREAADYLGAAIQTYQHWEQGHSVPKGAAMRGIERAMEDQQT